MGHDMAPVTRGIADREKDRFVLPARFREGFFAPWIPVHRVVSVLEKVWRLLLAQTVSENGIGWLLLSHDRDTRRE